MQEKEFLQHDDQPFYLSPTHLDMVFDNIMTEVRRKYDLWPISNVKFMKGGEKKLRM